MDQIRLSPRLSVIAEMAGNCDTLADIGTDHAFLPAVMVGQGRCRRAFACDVNRGPLERARNTVMNAGCADRVTLILSDGLSSVPPEYDVLVIAGMGGDLISSILHRDPPDPSVRLLLQPMTKPETLRRFLDAEGYSILRERAVCEGEKPYLILEAVRRPGQPGDPELPRNLEHTPDAPVYLKKMLRACRRRLTGLRNAVCPDAAAIADTERLEAAWNKMEKEYTENVK